MRVDWKNLKKFINDTKLQHFVNYFELENEVYVWLSYQNESFNCLLTKASVEYEDFETNFKPLAILKDDIAADGFTYIKSTHVLDGRFLNANFVVITTSKTEHNDQTEYISIKLLDENGQETTSENTVKTCIDFEPPFDYEIYGGGIETLEVMDSEFYVSAIIAPTIPCSQGRTVYNIRNKLLLQPKENVFKAGIGPAELKYNAGLHTNLVRIQLTHGKGIQKKFQLELQYYV